MASPPIPPQAVHGVDIDEDVVMLDIARDAYICVPGAGAAFRDMMRGDETPDASALRTGLEAASLCLVPSSNAWVAALPQATMLSDRYSEALRGRDFMNLAGAWMDLIVRYNGREFAAVLSAVKRHRQSHLPEAVGPELRRLCQVFQTAVIWLPASGKCLVRSFLLLRFLQRSGHEALWVFGVRIWPFAAHCWLQVGDVALDDFPERVSAYTPIYAI